VPRPVGQSQGRGDNEGVKGDVPERGRGHLLLGTMLQVTATFLSQRALAMACQRVRTLEELLEHSRTSERVVTEGGADYLSRTLGGVQHPREARIPGGRRLRAT